MKFASCVLLAVIIFTSSIFCDLDNANFHQVIKDGKEALPVIIDWSMQRMREYPMVPGLMTAAFLSKIKESFRGKRSSFLVWSTLGTVVFAEPYRLFATEYLVQRAQQKKDGVFVSELTKTKESAQVALTAVKKAMNKGSNELKENVSEKIEELIGNNSK